MAVRIRLASRIAAGLIAMGALWAGVPAKTGAAGAPILTASCEGPREASASGPGVQRFAQTFIPRVGGSLTRAEIDVTKAPGSSGNWVMEVFTLKPIPIGTVSYDVTASTTIPDAEVPVGSSTIAGAFEDPATVYAGSLPRREYQLVVTRPGASDLTVGYRAGNDCAGQLFRSSSQTGPFAPFPDAGADLVFRAYVSDLEPPQTRFARKPKRRTTRRRAKFKLRASEAGARFECGLDGDALEACDARERFRVSRGRHVFKAGAIDLAGNADPTPAKRRWKVVR